MASLLALISTTYFAVCGLVALLSAQFHLWSFSPSGAIRWAAAIGGPLAGFEVAIGRYFHTWIQSKTLRQRQSVLSTL